MLQRSIATSIVVFALVSASRIASAQTDLAPPPAAPAPPPSTEPTTPPVDAAPPPTAEPPPAGDGTTTTTTVETTTPPPTPPPGTEPPKEDEGVGFKWVYLVPEVGYSYVNLKSFSETDLALVDSSKSGAVVGAGAGVRIVFLTLGVRARHHFGMDMWQVLGEAGLHFKVNRVDPYLTLRGGYDTIGTNFSQAVGNATGDVKVDVHGFNFGAGIGLDYFVADNFTMGVEGSGDLLFLTRPPAPLPAGLTPQQKALIQSDPLYQKSGSSVGFGGVLAFRLGLHF